MEWQDARTCVKLYCNNHDIALNYSKIEDFENGMLTVYEPGFDVCPIKLSWCGLFDSILLKEHLDKSISKECFMIWNDMIVE